MKFLKSGYTASSLVYILIGLALLIWPELSLKVVCYLFGALIMVKGISSIRSYVKAQERFFFSYFSLVFGISMIALGLFLFIRPSTVVSILPILVGIFVIFDGIVRFQSAFELRAAGHSSWWSFLLLAILSAGLGLVMLFNPFASVQVLVMAIGVILLLEGALNLLSNIYAGAILRTLRKTADKVSDTVSDLFDGEPMAEDPRKDDTTIVDVDCRPVDDD